MFSKCQCQAIYLTDFKNHILFTFFNPNKSMNHKHISNFNYFYRFQKINQAHFQIPNFSSSSHDFLPNIIEKTSSINYFEIFEQKIIESTTTPSFFLLLFEQSKSRRMRFNWQAHCSEVYTKGKNINQQKIQQYGSVACMERHYKIM